MCRGSCYNNNSTEKSLFKTIAEIKNFAILETIQNIRMQISEIIEQLYWSVYFQNFSWRFCAKNI